MRRFSIYVLVLNINHDRKGIFNFPLTVWQPFMPTARVHLHQFEKNIWITEYKTHQSSNLGNSYRQGNSLQWVKRQEFYKVVLHHECFPGMFWMFSNQFCESYIRGCSCNGRDELESCRSVYRSNRPEVFCKKVFLEI